MLKGMARAQNSGKTPFGGAARRFLQFGARRGMRSIEIDPEVFRRELSEKHGLWVPNLARLKEVPIEHLDTVAARLIRDAERLALVEGAGLGLGGIITFLPDVSFLTIITLRLIQRLALLYGFETRESEQRIEMWKAAAAATGIDYGKDLAGKQMCEKIAPRVAKELAGKWVGRMVPLASSAIGGALNFSFVRGWGRRTQRQLRAKHLEAKERAAAPRRTYTAA